MNSSERNWRRGKGRLITQVDKLSHASDSLDKDYPDEVLDDLSDPGKETHARPVSAGEPEVDDFPLPENDDRWQDQQGTWHEAAKGWEGCTGGVVLLLLLWYLLIISCVVHSAHKRGRDGVFWGFLAFLIGPLAYPFLWVAGMTEAERVRRIEVDEQARMKARAGLAE